MKHRNLALRVAPTLFMIGLGVLLLATACSPPVEETAKSTTSATTTASGTETRSVADVITTTSTIAAIATPYTESVDSRPLLTSTPLANTNVHLTLWTVESISPHAEGEAGQAFEQGLDAFERVYPSASVSVVLKNPSGKGSVLDYLRTASEVAPSVLPDVVVLGTEDLANAGRAGTLVPLDDLLPPELVDDLLPAARAAGTVEGQLMAIPFEMDVEHLIYNTNKVAQTPITWTDVLSANTTYVFPAKGRNGLVNDAFLIQYLAQGGKFRDEEGQVGLNEEILLSVLEYYHNGSMLGIIPPEVLQIGNTDDIWLTYVSGQVGMAHISSHRFMVDRGVLRTTQYADVPTRNGNALTICRGNALAVTTWDPVQQAMAVRLIEWLLVPDNNIVWNQAADYLPTRYSAFEQIGQEDPYWIFLQHQLEVAVPPPTFTEYDQIGRVLQQAVVEVLSDESTPQEAASAALDAIGR